MKISAIIAEYNPFHNGHAYHIQKTREYGADAVIAVLGGNFAQRGDVSLLPKLSKAKAAMRSGVDLVIELPCVYSLGAAKDFALGAVKLLNALGCVETLSFGCEADLSSLLQTARIISELEIRENLKSAMENGRGFAGAREAMLRGNGFEKEADAIRSPNNILAIEYILALNATGSSITPMAVSRTGAAHDELFENACFSKADTICSASQLRKMILQKTEEIGRFMPASSVEVLLEETEKGRAPICLGDLEQAILSRLRTFSSAYLKNINGVSEGLENRILYAIRNTSTLDELITSATTKRYTSARIRRILLCACLGITKALVASDPPYIRVLASNTIGFEILKKAKHTSALPLVTRTGRLSSLSSAAASFSSIECAAFDLYALAFHPPGKCGLELTETNF